MMATLWLKFPDEVLFSSRFSDDDKRKLENIFSTADLQSPWQQALARLRFKATEPDVRLINWHDRAPYFNWSCLARTVSGGAIQPVLAPDGGYEMQVSYKRPYLWALLASQWKIARFARPDGQKENDLAGSIALGLVLQALVLRLGAQTGHMAAWLAAPDVAPQQYRKTIRQIQAVQMRRTDMSNVWKEAFPASSGEKAPMEDLPDFFWDDAAPGPGNKATSPLAEAGKDGVWKGVSVCVGTVTGLAVAVPAVPGPAKLLALKEKYKAPLILVFRRARPETTELFSYADALVFAEGGVLSHACTVAREMSIPSVTAVGPGFYDFVGNGEKIWLSLDGGGATVKILPTLPL
jgi:phosphohistidine swiveling domain-containing protein